MKKSKVSSAVTPIDLPVSGLMSDHRGDVISLMAIARME